MIELPFGYEIDKYGFIKQSSHTTFNYDVDYKMRQGTTAEMAFMRIGWICAVIGYENVSKFNVVDIGCGNGMFVECAKKVFKSAYGFDLDGESITKEELLKTEWDLIVLTDVIEHMEDIDSIFDINWKYSMISFPETPDVSEFDELRNWRHFKPNEHLYFLKSVGVKEWMERNGCEVICQDCFEDAIRKRWDKNKINISSILSKRLEI